MSVHAEKLDALLAAATGCREYTYSPGIFDPMTPGRQLYAVIHLSKRQLEAVVKALQLAKAEPLVVARTKFEKALGEWRNDDLYGCYREAKGTVAAWSIATERACGMTSTHCAKRWGRAGPPCWYHEKGDETQANLAAIVKEMRDAAGMHD